jgi:hypothetical protein
MLGSLVMVVALPDAFTTRGLVFAGAYVAIHIGRQLFLVLALRGHELQSRSNPGARGPRADANPSRRHHPARECPRSAGPCSRS